MRRARANIPCAEARRWRHTRRAGTRAPARRRRWPHGTPDAAKARARRRWRSRGTARPHRTQARDTPHAAAGRSNAEIAERLVISHRMLATTSTAAHSPPSRGSTGSPLPGRVPLPHRCERLASHASDDRKGHDARAPDAADLRLLHSPEASDSLRASLPCGRRSSRAGTSSRYPRALARRRLRASHGTRETALRIGLRPPLGLARLGSVSPARLAAGPPSRAAG
jgi:hypothetical protein